MDELTAAREIIDACDREMAMLFERRMVLADFLCIRYGTDALGSCKK